MKAENWVVIAGVALFAAVLIYGGFGGTGSGTANTAITGVQYNGAGIPAGNMGMVPFPAGAPDGAAVNATPGASMQGGTGGGYVAPGIMLSEGHWQGLEVMPLTQELKQKLNIPKEMQGLLIDEVTLNAAASGMRAGDILVAAAGITVNSIEELIEASRGVKNAGAVNMSVMRKTVPMDFTMSAAPELGIVQAETAPMIPPGAIMPHPYRGECTKCHPIGMMGHIQPDPDGIILPPPPIRAGVNCPHNDRGPCAACHTILN